jgi:hypothetical protein
MFIQEMVLWFSKFSTAFSYAGPADTTVPAIHTGFFPIHTAFWPEEDPLQEKYPKLFICQIKQMEQVPFPVGRRLY